MARPHYEIYESEETDWVNLQKNVLYRWNEFEWSPIQNNTYVYEDGRWQSLIYNRVPGNTWAETFMDGYANSVSMELLGGSGGTAPNNSLNVGAMTTQEGSGLFSRFIQLNSGDGCMRWNVAGRNRIFGRLYLNPQTGTSAYNRNIFRFLDRAGTEVGALSLYTSASGASVSSNNRIVLFNRGSVAIQDGEYIATGLGDIPPNQWTRFEFMVEPGRIIYLRVFNDPQSTVPSHSYFFDISSYNFSSIHMIEVGESARTYPTARQPLRIAHLAFSDSEWPGPTDLNKIRLIDHQGNIIDTNSTSCPMVKNAVGAGSYVVVAVAYSDAFSTTAIPKITAPEGFELLGFEAVMNTGGDIRTFLYVYGKYFSSPDSSAKTFTVGNNRSGRWMTNERHYINVNPINPIASTWQGETNAIRGAGKVDIRPGSIASPISGDVALAYVISKVDDNNTGLTSGQVVSVKSQPALVGGPGFRSYREVTPGRKSMLASVDQGLAAYSPHPIVGIQVNRSSSTTSAYGSLSLRNASQPTSGSFVPFTLPESLSDLYVPPAPEPEPEYETKTTTWSGTWQASWYSFGKRDGTNIYQGRVDSTTGYQCAQIGFDDAAIRSTLADATTISKVEVYFKNSHFYSASGGEIVLGTHDNTNEPANPSTGEKWNRTRADFNHGQGKWFTVSNSFGTDFKSGAARGLTLGRPNAGTLAEYAYFVGSGTDRPKIRITYTKPVS